MLVESVQALVKTILEAYFRASDLRSFILTLLMSPEQRDSAEGQLALKSGIELMKQRTKRYAVQQEKWLRNRFLRHSDDNYAPVYLLNADSLVESDWTTGVRQPAFEIVEALLKSDENILLKHSTRLATEPRGLVGSSSSLDDSESDSVRIGRSLELRCDHCGVTFAQRDQYKEHMSSRRHAKRMAGLRRLAARIAAVIPTRMPLWLSTGMLKLLTVAKNQQLTIMTQGVLLRGLLLDE
ncbi:hypothetical protein BOX15_Mlig003836g2 [Macrostomum lignano]|uniref:C2H2-type domain-containing protein n=1 Tax=Macrostomum lignano TaxID=282301 RepID=A0A267DJ67_9PLAT|nr:hypothetical protein BOX15_Mlig003836g2 [Macrostomum lignano]